MEGFGEKEDSKPFSHITWEKFEKVLMLVGYSEKEKGMCCVTKEIGSDCVMPLIFWNSLYHNFMLP